MAVKRVLRLQIERIRRFVRGAAALNLLSDCDRHTTTLHVRFRYNRIQGFRNFTSIELMGIRR